MQTIYLVLQKKNNQTLNLLLTPTLEPELKNVFHNHKEKQSKFRIFIGALELFKGTCVFCRGGIWKSEQ